MKKDEIKYVDLNVEPMNESNYVYTYCDNCHLPLNNVIKIPRPERTNYIDFTCPKCGKSIRVLAKGSGKERATLESLVKANYQVAEITGNWSDPDLIKNLTKLVM